MIKWCALLYILRMASDHVLGCSWGHNWLIWMKFSENVHRTFQFLGCTSIELKKKPTKFAKCIYWFKLIHTWLWSKNLELKIHIHRFYSSLWSLRWKKYGENISQNLIWQPIFFTKTFFLSKQKILFFNITFWPNFHSVVWNF